MAYQYPPLQLGGVREHTEGYPVEIIRHSDTGRLAIRASNEGGNNVTEVDLWDVIDYLRLGPEDGRTSDGFSISLASASEQP